MVAFQELFRAQYLFLLLREFALVEIAAHIHQLLRGERTALFALFKHLPILPPFVYHIEMLVGYSET